MSARTLASLVFANGQHLWLIAAIFLVAVLTIAWNYRVAPRGGIRWACSVLKAVGFCALLICLLEPLWSGRRARPGANLMAILADNSRGLRIKDRGETRTRGELLADWLNPRKARWQGALDEDFDVRRYLFDARLQSSRDFSDLSFDGQSTALGAALRNVLERYQQRPLAGILMFTDGNATDISAAPDLPGSPPIYPVVVGHSGPVRDIAVSQVRASETDFEDAPVSIQADISAIGCAGESIAAFVFDAAGKQVAEQRQKARSDSENLSFRFRLRPDKPGPAFYRVHAIARAEVDAKDARATQEATLENNDGFVAVDRGHGPYRILYVSGRPNWEFKFMNRALAEDQQLQLTALIRVAKREPKFNFIGRAGETSNPLFRGFGNQSPEEVERYDQPVLVRLNTKDPQELRTGFPKTPEELYSFHAVILDDVEADFFSPDQASLLQRFVSERGGGLLMLGGMESFQDGKYQRTPIGDMLPVYLDAPEKVRAPGPFRFDLTREGLLQPWARVRDNEADEKSRLHSMTPFQVFNTVRQVKPGASVIATVTDSDGQSSPAIAVQRFGNGRAAALMIGDLWRWGLHDPEAHADLDKTWRQFLRWLVTDVPNRVELLAQPKPDLGSGAVALRVRVRDPKFKPLDNASVQLEVRPVLVGSDQNRTNVIRLTAEPAAHEAGLYEASYVPPGPGAFQASVTVTNEMGAELGRALAGWTSDLASAEFHSLVPNVALLEQIARRTGGQVLTPGQLDGFVKGLPRRRAPVMEPWTFPAWHTPLFFGFALACFAGEWGLRRWKGLP